MIDNNKPLNFRNFFGEYALAPLSSQLSLKERIVALTLSILMGIATLGVVHFTLLALRRYKVNPKTPQIEKIQNISQQTIKNEPAPQDLSKTSNSELKNDPISKDFEYFWGYFKEYLSRIKENKLPNSETGYYAYICDRCKDSSFWMLKTNPSLVKEIEEKAKNIQNHELPTTNTRNEGMNSDPISAYRNYLEAKYPFRFHGVLDEKQLDFEKFIQGVYQYWPKNYPLAFLINIGRHWSFIFMDENRRELQYVDSGGGCAVRNEVKRLCESLSQMSPDKPPFRFTIPITDKVQVDYRCGIWVCYLLEKLLENPDKSLMQNFTTPEGRFDIDKATREIDAFEIHMQKTIMAISSKVTSVI